MSLSTIEIRPRSRPIVLLTWPLSSKSEPLEGLGAGAVDDLDADDLGRLAGREDQLPGGDREVAVAEVASAGGRPWVV